MPEPLPESNSALPGRRTSPLKPWSYLQKFFDDRFQRRRDELRRYLEVAAPAALEADRLYRQWREAVEVSEPIQDCQKAANLSAGYWWQITERLRGFQGITPPKIAKRYHAVFLEALTNASVGSEVTKNGFRFNKLSEVSRGMGYLDRYLELMAQAEAEVGELIRKYRLIGEEE